MIPQYDLVPDPESSQALNPALSHLRELRDLAAEHEANDIADSTRRNYDRDWSAFERWCKRMQIPALPVDAEIVSLYVTDMARAITIEGEPKYKVSTLRRHVASIARINYEAGGGKGLGEDPRITRVLSGLARQRQDPRSPRAPLLRKDVVNIIETMDYNHWPAGVTSARDTFAILVGFATALRRENVASLTAGDIEVSHEDGLHIHIGRTKTDQEGVGAVLGIPFGQHPITCVPCAWHRWSSLLAAENRSQRMSLVLRTPEDPNDWRHVCRGAFPKLDDDEPAVARVTKGGNLMRQSVSGSALYERLKIRVSAAGYDPTQYGFHSLRAGFVTQALMNGASTREVQKQTLHSSEKMVQHYDRDYLPLRGNAVTKIGL